MTEIEKMITDPKITKYTSKCEKCGIYHRPDYDCTMLIKVLDKVRKNVAR